jgi:hypothetical protein
VEYERFLKGRGKAREEDGSDAYETFEDQAAEMEGEEDENEELPMSTIVIPISPPEEGPRDSSVSV